jgi:nucleoside-diphosphate-sugar epimerase
VSELRGRRVLVTGASGFIGGRIVERLVSEEGASVRALLRELAGGVRISRHPVELAQGDVTDHRAVFKAAEGCDLIIHCAFGTHGDAAARRAVTVDGTRNVLEAGIRAGVRRVVHLSTVMVYGVTSTPVLRETLPRRAPGDAYGDAKLEAEELAFRYHRERGLPVTVVQPALVYGRFGVAWTQRVLEQLQAGLVPLIDSGAGVCNAVYVDDVAEAVLLAAGSEQAVGEAFLISGEPITYRDFYERFAQMVGGRRTVPMSADEAIERWRARRRQDELASRRVLHRLGETRPGEALIRLAERAELWLTERFADGKPAEDQPGERVHLPDPVSVRLQAQVARASTEKARQRLGWEPKFDFEAGARLTEQWARWANLVPPRPGSAGDESALLDPLGPGA